MRYKINKEVLCVLKYKHNEINIEYEPIEDFFIQEKNTFGQLCNKTCDNLNNIISYLRTTQSLIQLQKNYKYCRKLDGSYQGFLVNFEQEIKLLILQKEIFFLNDKNNELTNSDEKIYDLQIDLYHKFLLWTSANNIERAYRKCFEDKSILTFSHRINGWSNPEYQLSKNFSVELKTNFGYGAASYFYIKIKYKEIEITPFSEWIDYEIAKFSEIARYTKSFANREFKGIYDGKRIYIKKIENGNWQDAIEFTKTACNISLANEDEFIKTYIVEECEKMVIGLEKIITNNKFEFIDEYNKHYSVDKKGHQLIEFRGEKISGALDFISKILEFDKISEVKSFIHRIELCNRKIQPLLLNELNNIIEKQDALKLEMAVTGPKYQILVSRNAYFIEQKKILKTHLISLKEFNNDNFELENFLILFEEKFPEFREFEIEFTTISKQYNILKEQIENFKKLFDKITTYNDKIVDYFSSDMI